MSAVARFSSPFTLRQQVQAHQGQIWKARVTIPEMDVDDAYEWIATLLALNGSEGTFYFGDPAQTTPRSGFLAGFGGYGQGPYGQGPYGGGSAGAPVVDGANQAGQTLITQGWEPSVNKILLKGDRFQLGNGETTRLYMLLRDVNSSDDGHALLDIWPRLRESPADQEALVLSSPKGVFRMADNKMDWSVRAPEIYGVELDIIEAL